MFVRHASATLRYTRASVNKDKSIQLLRVTKGTERKLPLCATRSQLCRFHTAPVTSTMENNMRINFSSGSDENTLTKALQELLDSAGKGGRWALLPTGQGLERSFKFKNFAKTWDFMTAVSLQCKLKTHHPEWSNVYNTAYIRWATHNPKGLSSKDVELAGICDSLARDFGEVIPDGTALDDTCDLRQVADRVVGDAGDCCTPNKKK